MGSSLFMNQGDPGDLSSAVKLVSLRPSLRSKYDRNHQDQRRLSCVRPDTPKAFPELIRVRQLHVLFIVAGKVREFKVDV